jgi:hypothetical protein
MNHIMHHFALDIKAPEGAVCYQCGAKAVVQCSCCEHCMCLQHTVCFSTLGQSEQAIVDYVECQSCDEQDES